jgi:hypothetical protein
MSEPLTQPEANVRATKPLTPDEEARLREMSLRGYEPGAQQWIEGLLATLDAERAPREGGLREATELLDAVETALAEHALAPSVQSRLKAAYNAVVEEANR